MEPALGEPSAHGRGALGRLGEWLLPQRRLALYAALTVFVLALTALAWNATTGGPAPDPTAHSGAASAPPSPADPGDLRGTPDSGNSGGEEADARRPSGESALVANPLYDTGRLSPLPCPAPALDIHDPDSVEGFLNAMADCLDDTWQRQFDRAGIPFHPPRRVFWREPGRSPCRDYPSAAGAFYCRADTGIYIGVEDVVRKWNEADDSVVYASLIAHEYGHHVQGESGLLEYYHERRGQETGREDQNSWTRKSELQANCFAGAFLGSVEVTYPLTAADRSVALDDARATADRANGPVDERTHGTPDNSSYWLSRGLDGQSPGTCNTWATENENLLQ
ncbi:neutral zinc metallopeptidase [Nocardiopsis rhodophaea]|uniref:neutral zinc metallopeptidase n=1 Tax=Nocardiopsis rhodophaea TaxID=280238 RepID=UPI0031D26A98